MDTDVYLVELREDDAREGLGIIGRVEQISQSDLPARAEEAHFAACGEDSLGITGQLDAAAALESLGWRVLPATAESRSQIAQQVRTQSRAALELSALPEADISTARWICDEAAETVRAVGENPDFKGLDLGALDIRAARAVVVGMQQRAVHWDAGREMELRWSEIRGAYLEAREALERGEGVLDRLEPEQRREVLRAMSGGERERAPETQPSR